MQCEARLPYLLRVTGWSIGNSDIDKMGTLIEGGNAHQLPAITKQINDILTGL